MKIFVAHSSNFDFRSELYLPIRNSLLNANHEFLLPQEGDKPEVITKNIIKNSDLIIAEVSYPSTGQGIELGWADVFQIPVICIYKRGSKISHSLTKITDQFIEYSNTNEMIKKLEKHLTQLRDLKGQIRSQPLD